MTLREEADALIAALARVLKRNHCDVAGSMPAHRLDVLRVECGTQLEDLLRLRDVFPRDQYEDFLLLASCGRPAEWADEDQSGLIAFMNDLTGRA